MTLRTTLLAAAALAVTGSGAFAQDYYGPSQEEQVIVEAPRYNVEDSHKLGAVPEKISLSQPVRYDDLDLTSREGAHELRYRVREAARDVCRQLAEDTGLHEIQGHNCFKEASDNALVKADEAIQDAREYRGYEVRYDTY